MSGKKSFQGFWSFWFLLMGLSMAPWGALAMESGGSEEGGTPKPTPAVTPFYKDPLQGLTLAQLNQYVRNFSVRKEGVDPSSTVVMSGMIFQDCSEATDFSIKGFPNERRWQFLDPLGTFRKCMEGHKADSCNGLPSKCIGLGELNSEKFATRLQLNESSGDGEVKLYQVNPDAEQGNPKHISEESFTPPIWHKTQKTMNEEREKALQARRAAAMASYRKILDACQGTLDELRKAEDAALRLVELGEKLAGGLPDEDQQKIAKLPETRTKLEKKKAEDELKEFMSRARAECHNGDVTGLRDEILAWADQARDRRDKVVPVFHEMARCILNRDPEKGSVKDIALAKAILKDAQQISGLSAKSREELAGYQLELTRGRLELLAQRGSFMNGEFEQRLMEHQRFLGKQYMQACWRTSASRTREGAVACNEAYNAMIYEPQSYRDQAQHWDRLLSGIGPGGFGFAGGPYGGTGYGFGAGGAGGYGGAYGAGGGAAFGGGGGPSLFGRDNLPYLPYGGGGGGRTPGSF